MIKTIAVLGAGNGGHAFCGQFALEGFEVRLYEAPQFKDNLVPIKKKGGIEVFGDRWGFAKVAVASTNMKEVVQGADVIIVPVPSFAQDHMMNEYLPHAEDGQIVLFSPDNSATLRYYPLLKKKGLDEKVTLAGMACLLYLCKRIGPAQIDIGGVKHKIQVSTMPAKNAKEVVDNLKSLYKGFTFEVNALVTSLSNFNHQLHTGPMVLNTGRVESCLDFKFYWEGHTPSVSKVVQAVDDEKLALAKALGYKLPTIQQLFDDYYEGRTQEGAKDLNKIITSNIVYRGVIAPKEMANRFLSEDVKDGMVLLASIGDQFNVPTPTIDSIIHLSSIINGEDYIKTGLTLEKLGLGGRSKEEIDAYLMNG